MYHRDPVSDIEFAIDGLKMASINTPNMLTTPLSIVAGIVFGDYTVNSGWFNSEIMLYMAFVAVANYTQANMELGYAIKFFRMLCLILTAALDWVVLSLKFTDCRCLVFKSCFEWQRISLSAVPVDGQQLLRRFFRVSLFYVEKKKTKPVKNSYCP